MNTIIVQTTVSPVNYNLPGYSIGGMDAELGDTLIQGTNLNDVMIGTEGYDLMRGYDGDDVMYGGYGNDRLAGYAGNNTMYGGDGDDYMFTGNGYTGVNIMNGGSGADHFVMNHSESNAMVGQNIMRIEDFNSKDDSIDIMTHDHSLSFSKFDTNNDGLLTTADKGVTTFTNADGTTGIQFSVSDHYAIQVQNQSQLSSSDIHIQAI